MKSRKGNNFAGQLDGFRSVRAKISTSRVHSEFGPDLTSTLPQWPSVYLLTALIIWLSSFPYKSSNDSDYLWVVRTRPAHTPSLSLASSSRYQPPPGERDIYTCTGCPESIASSDGDEIRVRSQHHGISAFRRPWLSSETPSAAPPIIQVGLMVSERIAVKYCRSRPVLSRTIRTS